MPAPDTRHYVARRENDPSLMACEALLADGLKEFLSELLMVNGGVVVSFICNKQHANLDDIIGSSTEHRIKPGRLYYGGQAQMDFDWGEAPSVSLSMELRDEQLNAFFRLVLGGDHIGIELNGIHFTDVIEHPEDIVRRFSATVADARIERTMQS